MAGRQPPILVFRSPRSGRSFEAWLFRRLRPQMRREVTAAIAAMLPREQSRATCSSRCRCHGPALFQLRFSVRRRVQRPPPDSATPGGGFGNCVRPSRRVYSARGSCLVPLKAPGTSLPEGYPSRRRTTRSASSSCSSTCRWRCALRLPCRAAPPSLTSERRRTAIASELQWRSIASPPALRRESLPAARESRVTASATSRTAARPPRRRHWGPWREISASNSRLPSEVDRSLRVQAATTAAVTRRRHSSS
jgi:hypothetical protein